MTKNSDKASVRVDAAVYSGEALRLAAFVFAGRAGIAVKAAGAGFYAVSFSGAAESFSPGDYFNEALNQQCRLDLAKKNAKAAGMIATRALLSAAGEGKTPKKRA